MSKENDNGEAVVVPAGETIQIVFTRKPYGVQLVARDVELHMTIAVLRTVLDELEAQLRIVRVQQLQQQAADAALAERIRQGMRQ